MKKRSLIEGIALDLVEAGCDALAGQAYEHAASSARWYSNHARDPDTHMLAADYQLKAAHAATRAGLTDKASYHFGHAGHHEKMAKTNFRALDYTGPKWYEY